MITTMLEAVFYQCLGLALTIANSILAKMALSVIQ